MVKSITNKGNKGALDNFHIEWLNEIWTSPTSFILTYKSILYWTTSINLSTRPIKIGMIFVYKQWKVKGCNLKKNFCSSFPLLLHIMFFQQCYCKLFRQNFGKLRKSLEMPSKRTPWENLGNFQIKAGKGLGIFYFFSHIWKGG